MIDTIEIWEFWPLKSFRLVVESLSDPTCVMLSGDIGNDDLGGVNEPVLLGLCGLNWKTSLAGDDTTRPASSPSACCDSGTLLSLVEASLLRSSSLIDDCRSRLTSSPPPPLRLTEAVWILMCVSLFKPSGLVSSRPSPLGVKCEIWMLSSLSQLS